MRIRREMILNKLRPSHTKVDRVLVLAPHPDDEIIGCGGTLLQHNEYGTSITFCYLTDGRHGGLQEPYCVAKIRKQEALSVASKFRNSRTYFLDNEDLSLESDSATAKELGRIIAETKADIIYLPSPFERHPDHKKTAELMRFIIAQDVLCSHLWECYLHFYEVWDAAYINCYSDITSQWTRKIEMIELYKSQMQYRIIELSEQMARLAAIRNQMPQCTYAELFFRVKYTEAIQYIDYSLKLSR